MKNSCKYNIFRPCISLSSSISSPLPLLPFSLPALSLCLSPRPSPPFLSPLPPPLFFAFGANLLKLFFHVSIPIRKTEWSKITSPSIFGFDPEQPHTSLSTDATRVHAKTYREPLPWPIACDSYSISISVTTLSYFWKLIFFIGITVTFIRTNILQ